MPEATAQVDAESDAVPDFAAMLDPPDWKKLDQILEDMPPGIPILPPEDVANFAKYRHKPNRIYAKGEAWQKCADLMEKYDADLCKSYREEIDTLLVFAGLFSAVVTGFCVESYKWLQDDTNDVIVGLLSQMVHSLEPNGTAPVAPHVPSGMSRSVSRRINAVWFVSLSLSLATGLVAILGKQWIREYERHPPIPPRDFAGLRQVKFEGLQYWKVGEIISALPLLLQLSLGLFLLGLSELLWQLDIAVGVAVLIPVIVTLFFYLATTLLPMGHYFMQLASPKPLSNPPCAYKSPQAFLALYVLCATNRGYALTDAVRHVCLRVLCWFRIYLRGLEPPENYFQPYRFPGPIPWSSWNDYEHLFSKVEGYNDQSIEPWAASRGLAWLVKTIDERHMKEIAWNCVWDDVQTESLWPREQLCCNISHPFSHPFVELPLWKLAPRTCAVLHVVCVNMEPDFVCEFLAQTSGNRGMARRRTCA